MDKDDIIATLNDLIETSRDGEAGFRLRGRRKECPAQTDV